MLSNYPGVILLTLILWWCINSSQIFWRQSRKMRNIEETSVRQYLRVGSLIQKKIRIFNKDIFYVSQNEENIFNRWFYVFVVLFVVLGCVLWIWGKITPLPKRGVKFPYIQYVVFSVGEIFTVENIQIMSWAVMVEKCLFFIFFSLLKTG